MTEEKAFDERVAEKLMQKDEYYSSKQKKILVVTFNPQIPVNTGIRIFLGTKNSVLRQFFIKIAQFVSIID